MTRRRMLQAFEAAKSIGNYADIPVMPVDVDPQITLARNTERQPFYLAFEEDTVIALMSGRATVRLRDTNVNYWPMMPGDHVYVPAGTPHRFEPAEESVVIRYIGNDPAYRAAVFACENCGNELDRLEWKQNLEVDATAIYTEVSQRFNQDLDRRTCAVCSTVADPVPLERLGWAPVAAPA
jgi:mannose-6-phosphate isomerase-like protein (cupin superfamily)